MRRICVLIVAMLAVAGCTPTPGTDAASRAPDQCFWASRVTGFSDAGPKRALVNIGTRETWQLTVSPGCPDIDWAMRIGIRSYGGERICAGRPAELLIPNASGSGFQRCLVNDVRKLPRAEGAREANPKP